MFRKSFLIKILLTFLFILPLTLFSQNNTSINNGYKWEIDTNNNVITVIIDISTNYYLYKDYTKIEIISSQNQVKTADNVETNEALPKEKKKVAQASSLKSQIITLINSPKAVEHTDDFGNKQLIYPEGEHTWIYKVSHSGDYKINIKYQGCSEKPFACYPPRTFEKEISIKNTINQNDKKSYKSSDNNINTSTVQQKPTINNLNNSYIGSMLAKGGIWIFLVALLGGLFSVFTPCVLPLLPITIAILGAGKEAKKTQAFKRSFLYVAGIVITFTALAVFASISGKAFGTALLSNPSVLTVFAFFFIAMSLSLLGIFDMQLPNSWNNALNKFGGGTDLGAFLMGLVAGFIAIPCTGPILATLLGISAASGNVFFAGLLLFIYALGFGIPFFIVGIGLVKAPKSGEYMDIVKSFLGIVILILAFYILTIAIPRFSNLLTTPSETYKMTAIILIIAGVLFGAFHSDGHSLKKTVRYFKVFGALILAFGILWIIKMPVGSSEQNLNWNTNLTQSFTSSRIENKPIILDFTAEWCAACKELESATFSNKSISEQLKNKWILARVDATRDSEELQKTLKKYNIKGFPTVIFFNSSGKEIDRFSGFVSPKIFQQYLDRIEVIK